MDGLSQVCSSRVSFWMLFRRRRRFATVARTITHLPAGGRVVYQAQQAQAGGAQAPPGQNPGYIRHRPAPATMPASSARSAASSVTARAVAKPHRSPRGRLAAGLLLNETETTAGVAAARGATDRSSG